MPENGSEIIGMVLPAHAGMIRTVEASRRAFTGAPRSRGDDPDAFELGSAVHTCSPLTRG